MKTYCKLPVVCLLLFLASCSIAQQMDAKLNMAKRALTDIESKLSHLQSADTPKYNKLSEQLSKTAILLQTTESKAHPDYVSSVQKWSALRETMITMAQQWQAQSAEQQTITSTSSTQQEQTAANNSVTSNDKYQQTNTIDPNKILAKYQRENRPKLANYPNPSEVSDWAKLMVALQTTELQQDLTN